MKPAPVVALGSATGFVCLTMLVLAKWGPLHEFDLEAARRATDLTRDHGGYRQMLTGLTNGLNSAWTLLAAVVIAALVWLRGRAGSALWVFGVVGIGNLVGPTFKQLVDRQRPDLPEPIATFSGLSFPSGHTGSATLAAAAVLLVAWPVLSPAARPAAVLLAAVVPLTAAWTRLALGAHYPSDVLGGLLLGTAWVAAWASLLPLLAHRLDRSELTPHQEAVRAT